MTKYNTKEDKWWNSFLVCDVKNLPLRLY
jgi:hypothetical protein